jgi:hypothetical protein
LKSFHRLGNGDQGQRRGVGGLAACAVVSASRFFG